jgi:glutaredoxin-related protein
MKGSPNLFWSGYRRKMLDDLFPDRQRGGTRPFVYSDDDIRKEASKYNSFPDFKKNSSSFYQLARKRGLLDDLFPDRRVGKGRVIKHSDDDIRREASKYNSQTEFMKGSPNLFYAALNRKMLDDLFPDRQRGKGRTIKYSDDDIRQEASKYNSLSNFQKNSPSFYQLARKRGLLDNLFPDRKIKIKYSDDEIRQEASKYNSQNEFMKGSPKMFYLASNRKMLDDLFPDRKIKIKYSDDEIRQEASKYNSKTEFRLGSPKFFYNAFAFNRKMLDDLFPNRRKRQN